MSEHPDNWTENCGNCAWRAQQTKWIETQGSAIDVRAFELLFRCALGNILHSLVDSCLCWMGFYGHLLQLDCFGGQEFGVKPNKVLFGVAVTQQHADEAEAWHGEQYRRVQEERYGKR